jgi:hypothetical protein
MPSKKEVKITNENGDEAYVHPSSVAAYERNGWTRADDGSSEELTAAAPPEVQQNPAAPTAPAKKTTTRKAD